MRQVYRKQIVVIMLVIVSLVMLGGCGLQQVQPDVQVKPLVQSKAAYAEALKIYYDNARTYKTYFRAADETTQEKWRKEISPLFADAKAALDMWKYFNDEGLLPDDATTSDWRAAKTEFLLKLNSIGAK